MNRSLLSTFYPVRNPYADDAQEALGAILEFIQMGAPARVTTGGAASQSGTCDTIPERVICNIIHTSYPYNTTHPTELQLSRSHCVSITAHIKVTPVLTMRRHVNRHPNGLNSRKEYKKIQFFVNYILKMNAVNGAPNPAALSKAEKKKFNAAIIAGRFAQEECRFEGNMMHVKQEQV